MAILGGNSRDVVDDDHDLEQLRAIRESIEDLSKAHLAALQRFTASEAFGRELPELGKKPVSLPMLVRTLPATNGTPQAQWQETHLSSTCAAVRSILRNPGVYYKYLRPLHLLSEMYVAVQEREGVRSLLEVSRVANAAIVLRDAVTPAFPWTAPPSDGVDLLQLVGQACLVQVHRDLRVFIEQSGNHMGDVALEGSMFGIRRLHRVRTLEMEVSRNSGGSRSSSIPDEVFSFLSVQSVPTTLVSIAEGTDTTNRPIGAGALVDLLVYATEHYGLPAQDKKPAYANEEGMSGLVADAVVRECGKQMATKLTDLLAKGALFKHFQPDGVTPAHPYSLYWTAVGWNSIPREGRPTPPAGAEAAGELLERVIVDARSEYYRHVARAAGGGTVDMFRLGYHLALELEHNKTDLDIEVAASALESLRDAQMADGTWPKRDRLWVGSGGDAYGFGIELLTSLLIGVEGLPTLQAILEPCLPKSLRWLERHAPADVSSPRAPVWGPALGAESLSPEAWATSEGYSFLYLANRYYDRVAARLAVERFDGHLPEETGTPDGKPLAAMDGEIWRGSRAKEPVETGRILAHNLVTPLESRHTYFGKYVLAGKADRQQRVRSGILYGPPGTGKTTYVENIAAALGWPLVSLSPYDFLRYGVDAVPATARLVFEYLLQLRDCVVLLDEMEEFVRSREHARGGPSTSEPNLLLNAEATRRLCAPEQDTVPSPRSTAPDFQQRLWTTLFLPLLQKLHHQASVLFFVATNHFENVDAAVARRGRFDFPLHVLPPTPERKVSHVLVPTLAEELHLDQKNRSVVKSVCDDAFIPPDRYVVMQDGQGNRDLRSAMPRSDAGTVRWPDPFVQLAVNMSDGGLRRAPMEIRTRFEWFTRADVEAMARRVVRSFPMSNRRNPPLEYTDMADRLLQAFEETVPTHYDWDPDRDLLVLSGLESPPSDDPA